MAHHFAAPLADPRLPRGRVWHVPLTAVTLVALLTLVSCSQPDQSRGPRGFEISAEEIEAAEREVAMMRRVVVADLRTASSALVAATDRFLDRPDSDTRAALQSAWQRTHRQYGILALFPGEQTEATPTWSVDTWPIQPGFMDSIPGYPDSGIINDIAVAIGEKTLREQHGFTDPSEASLGFHPIEHYAFDRPIGDFDPTSSEVAVVRRRAATGVMVQTLDKALQELADAPFALGDSGDPESRLRALITVHRLAVENAIAEANRRGDDGSGHPGYVARASGILEGIVGALDDLYARDTRLGEITFKLDNEVATELGETLDRGRGDEGGSEFTLPLWMAVVSTQLSLLEHQLTDSRD